MNVRVVELWRYPVKSLQGERLDDEVTLTTAGVEGVDVAPVSTLSPVSGLPGGGFLSCCARRPLWPTTVEWT